MRDFDWSHRAAHVLGGIIEALIVLLAVAVIAGVLFLLVRYLLVATRAAQLYVDQHEPPRRDTRLGGGPFPTDPAAPTTPASYAAAPASPGMTTEAPSADGPPPMAPTAQSDAAAPTEVLGEQPPTVANAAPETAATKPLTRPATKPRTPKTPPAK